MNLLTLTRLGGNFLVLGAAGAFVVSAIAGGSVQPWQVAVMGALALLGGLAQMLVSIVRPKTIKPAWDEQTVASHRGSYQFGYWAALIGFWCLLGLSQFAGIDLGIAFVWLGVILLSAPSAWMVVSTLLGRAG